jgi:arsenate reductase
MAEGWLNSIGRESVTAVSAGTMPTFVHPLAIRVMGEAGIDLSNHRSKSVEEFIGREFDAVVTVCDHARETCPVFPGRHLTMHMPFNDPAGATGTEEERLVVFRRVRDEIGRGMHALIERLTATGE